MTFKKTGFTLAEMLITLVVIAIVAILTIPNLVYNYKKRVATTRLKNFYSTMTQAVSLAEVDFGPTVSWEKALADITDEEGNTDYLAQAEASWTYWEKYLAPYIKYVRAEKGIYDENDPTAYFETKVYLSDGTVMYLHNGSAIDLDVDVNGDSLPNEYGKDIFKFVIKSSTTNPWTTQKSFSVIYEPIYTTREAALSACINAAGVCSRLLLHDNWEFKEDYPYKF